MKLGRIVELGFIHALSAIGYVGLVVLTISYVETAQLEKGPLSLLLPMGFLLLFSASAGVMASIVFLRPILWFFEGKKKEGLILLATTVGFLACGAFVIVIGAAALSMH